MRKLEEIATREFDERIILGGATRDGMLLVATRALHTPLLVNGHRAHLVGLFGESLKWAGGFYVPGESYDDRGVPLTNPAVNKVLFYNHYVALETWTSSVDLPDSVGCSGPTQKLVEERP